MKGVKVIAALMLGSILAVCVRAEIKPGDDNQFTTIGIRNIFDLRPVPPPPTGQQQTAPQINVKLTGITTILGPRQAVFSTQEAGKPTPVTVVLGEGERQGGIEVAKIDMQEHSANVTIDGRPMTLHLEEPKSMGGAPAGAAAPLPGTTAAAVAALAPRGGGPAAPVAPATQPYYGRGGGPQPDPNAFSYGDPNTTARPVRTSAQGAQGNFTPEQQVLLIEAQRAQALKNDPAVANLLPPTPLTPMIQQDHQNATQPPPQMPGFPPAPNQPLGTRVTGTGGVLVPK